MRSTPASAIATGPAPVPRTAHRPVHLQQRPAHEVATLMPESRRAYYAPTITLGLRHPCALLGPFDTGTIVSTTSREGCECARVQFDGRQWLYDVRDLLHGHAPAPPASAPEPAAANATGPAAQQAEEEDNDDDDDDDGEPEICGPAPRPIHHKAPLGGFHEMLTNIRLCGGKLFQDLFLRDLISTWRPTEGREGWLLTPVHVSSLIRCDSVDFVAIADAFC